MILSNKDNTLIIKNTLLLYGRQFIVMAVSLFTSRVVLKTLGAEDYGIYGVVGGIVYLFGFINSSLSSATSRFITFEMGRGNISSLRETISSAFLCHLCIAFLVILLSEVLGRWWLLNKMVIPDGRMGAAMWVFHLSIISAAISITQVPYSASIISHEKIDIYAYVEMIVVVLKLLILYILVIGPFDKLILYSILLFILSVGQVLFYRVYCIIHYPECRHNISFNKSLLKRMLSFSGWDLFGNLSVTARTQGIAILINMFFGVIANAASSIAGQVQGAVMSFSSNILLSVKPQIVKSYAATDYQRTRELLLTAFKVIFYLMSLISIPLIVEMDFVLNVWLVEVPPYCSIFCRFVLVFNLFSGLAMLFLTIPHAAEKNKYPSLINGSLYLMALPFSYFVFKSSKIIWFPYCYNVVTMFLGFMVISYLACKYLPTLSKGDVYKTLVINSLPILATVVILLYVRSLIIPSWGRLILVTCISSFFISLSGFLLALSSEQRRSFLRFIHHQVIHRKSSQ